MKLTQDELARHLGKEQPHIARAENKGKKPAFENYADQFTLISHLKAEKVRQTKEDADWIEDIFSAEDFENAPLAKVTLKSA